jgi:hypothetical protein
MDINDFNKRFLDHVKYKLPQYKYRVVNGKVGLLNIRSVVCGVKQQKSKVRAGRQFERGFPQKFAFGFS